MANKKISELTSRTPSLTDLILVGDPSSGYSYKATVTALATIIETDIADAYVTLSTTQTISGAKTFSNNITATSVANAASDPDKFLVLNGSNVINYRTGTQVLSDIGGADDSLVVHKAGAETITGAKTFNAGIVLPNYQQVSLSNSASVEGYDGKVLFRTVYGTAGYFQNNSLGLAEMDNETGTSGIGILVKSYGSESLVKYKTAAQVLSMIGGQGALTLTTTGTSGAATLVGNTLNIPQYQAVLTNPVTGTGTTNYITKFTSSSEVGNSVIYESSSNIGIGTITPSAKLSVNGNAILSGSLNATENYLDSPNGLVLELNSTNANGGYADFKTNSTIIGRIGTATQVLGSGGTSIFAISSRGANAFVLGSNGTEGIRIANGGAVSIANIANATTDTDKFLVSDGGVIKYRTGTELLSDIGGASSSSISGTTNYIPKFTSSSAIGNSVMRESSSKIGIGTSSPTVDLDIENATTWAGLDLNGASGGEIRLQTSGTTYGQIYAGSSTALIINGTSESIFQTSGIERMRLTSTGLGIGTSSPGTKLDVNGSIRLSGTGYIGFGGGTNYIEGDNPNNILKFATNNAERMRLDASGNLGLGVTPSAWRSTDKVLQINNTALFDENGTNMWIGLNFYENTSGSYIYSNNGYATAYRQQTGQHNWFTAPSGTAGNAISFTQAMTLDASGRLGIGTSSPATPLQVDASSGGIVRVSRLGTGSGIFQMEADGTNGSLSATNAMIFNTNSTERMRITSGGEVYIAGTTDQGAYNLQVNGTGVWGAGAYVNGSDSSLKENIQNMGSALSLVNQLQPKTFTYKPTYSKDTTIQVGFIAQDLEQVLGTEIYKNSIVVDGPNFKSVAYQNLIPLLVQSIKELKAEIETLKNK